MVMISLRKDVSDKLNINSFSVAYGVSDIHLVDDFGREKLVF